MGCRLVVNDLACCPNVVPDLNNSAPNGGGLFAKELMFLRKIWRARRDSTPNPQILQLCSIQLSYGRLAAAGARWARPGGGGSYSHRRAMARTECPIRPGARNGNSACSAALRCVRSGPARRRRNEIIFFRFSRLLDSRGGIRNHHVGVASLWSRPRRGRAAVRLLFYRRCVANAPDSQSAPAAQSPRPRAGACRRDAAGRRTVGFRAALPLAPQLNAPDPRGAVAPSAAPSNASPPLARAVSVADRRQRYARRPRRRRPRSRQ